MSTIAATSQSIQKLWEYLITEQRLQLLPHPNLFITLQLPNQVAWESASDFVFLLCKFMY